MIKIIGWTPIPYDDIDDNKKDRVESTRKFKKYGILAIIYIFYLKVFYDYIEIEESVDE